MLPKGTVLVCHRPGSLIQHGADGWEIVSSVKRNTERMEAEFEYWDSKSDRSFPGTRSTL